MALAQWGNRIQPAGHGADRLGTVRSKWVSLPPVFCSPLSAVPPEESYKIHSWLCQPLARLACVAFIRENPNLDQQSGSSIPAAASPPTPTDPGPFARAVSSRNSLIPSSSPGSKSSFKTAFRCFHLRKGTLIVPSSVFPQHLVLTRGRALLGLCNLSAHVCLAASPACLRAGVSDYSPVSGTVSMFKKSLLTGCMGGIITPYIFWYLCCCGWFCGFRHLLTTFRPYL